MANMNQTTSDNPAVAHLQAILSSNRRHFRHVAGYSALQALDRSLLGLDCDEVYPKLYIADKTTARDIGYLRCLGVTHILNVAEQGVEDAVWYNGSNIFYMGIPMADDVSFQVSNYFHITAGYIDQAIKTGGKVLINCIRGVSRSGAVAVSYLMLKCGVDISLALRIILQNRNIRPNDGFLYQLHILDQTIQRNGVNHSVT